MDGDFSRVPPSRANGRRSVWMQQGRTLLDSDWNEQVALQEANLAATTRDIVGDGGPADRLGFSLEERPFWHFAPDVVLRLAVEAPGRVVFEVTMEVAGSGRLVAAVDGSFVLRAEGGTLEIVVAEVVVHRRDSPRAAFSLVLQCGEGRCAVAIDGEEIVLDAEVRGDLLLGPAAGEDLELRLFGLEVTAGEASIYDHLDGRSRWAHAVGERSLRLEPAEQTAVGPRRRSHLRVGPGRYYAGGFAVENDREQALEALPGPSLPTRDGRYFAELWVRRHLVSAVSDPTILDPALHGADTTVREVLSWQVRVLPLAATSRGAPPARLTVRRVPGGSRPDNRVYRIEAVTPAGAPGPAVVDGDGSQLRCRLGADVGDLLHVGDAVVARVTGRKELGNPDAGDPTPAVVLELDRRVGAPGESPWVRPIAGLAWSRTNGSATLRLASVTANGSGVATLALGEPNGARENTFSTGDHLEIADDDTPGSDRRGTLLLVQDVPDATNLVVKVPHGWQPPALAPSKHPYIRRWDQRGPDLADGLVPAIPGEWLTLERGLEVRIEPGPVPAGAAWSFTTREAWPTPEWPTTPDGTPMPQPPELPIVARTPLALLERRRGEWRVERDLRVAFPTLREIVTEGLKGPIPGDLQVQGSLGVQDELRVEGRAVVRGDLHARRLHGSLADAVVGTDALEDGSVTAAKLAVDVGFVPPHALLLAEGPVPAGYTETGETLTLPRAHTPWVADGEDSGRIAVVGNRLLRIAPDGTVWWRALHGGDWTAGPSLPAPLTAYALVVCLGRAHLLGGKNHLGLETRTHLVLGASGWEPRQRLPWAVSEVAAGVVDDHIVIAGGQRALLGWLRFPSRAVAAWNPQEDTWQRLPALPRAVADATGDTVAGRMHVVGGRTWLGKVLTQHAAWGAGEREWTTRRDLPEPVRGAFAAGERGSLWVVGGLGRPVGLRYDVAFDAWVREPSPPGAAGCGLHHGTLWVGQPLARRSVAAHLRTVRYAGTASTSAATEASPTATPAHTAQVLPVHRHADPASTASAATPAARSAGPLPALLALAQPPAALSALARWARVLGILGAGIGGGWTLSTQKLPGCAQAPESATPIAQGTSTAPTRTTPAGSSTAGAATNPASATTKTPEGGDTDWLAGLDVSHHQGVIDWHKVAQSKAFVFIKATDGNGRDPRFHRNWSEAGAVGLKRGAYHFFRPNEDGVEQARTLLATVGADRGELPLALDLEVALGERCETIVTRAVAFLEHIESETKRKPILYANDHELRLLACDRTELQAYSLWIAAWDTNPPTELFGWGHWTFWQHSHAGSVPGIQGDVDLDWYSGTADTLEELGR